MLLSVVICTWNRAESLSDTLDSLSSVAIPTAWQWEVVVIDNNSGDDTQNVVTRHRDTLPIRYVFERRQGLSYARNRALEEARGDLIVFTDDDVLADPRWLTEYAAAYQSFPHASFFGGTVALRFAAPPPRWLADNLDRFAPAYAHRDIDTGVRAIASVDELPFGANMGFRRAAFSTRGFATHLGRTGGDLLSGEETEFMMQLLKRGDVGVWIGPARVEHIIPAERMTTSYIYNYFFWQGRGKIRQRPQKTNSSAVSLMTKSLCFRLRTMLSFRRKNGWAAAFTQYAMTRGKIDELRTYR